jgi:hypothetical protein
MGCDGGTIPRRDELVRTKKKPEQVDKDAEIAAKWRHCALTQQPLVPPIICCELGRLYNKEAVITHILEKGQGTEIAKHIKGMKDVMELKLTENTEYTGDGPEKGDGYVDRQSAQYICPVVGIEMNGKYRFCYLRTCGCVLSEKAMKEVSSATCHKCGAPYTAEDVIIINGTDEDVEILRARMIERRAKAKADKKAKKEEKGTKRQAVEENVEKVPEEASSSKQPKLTKEANGGNGKPKTSKLIGAPVAVAGGSGLKPEDKIKSSYSVAKDPTASEAFKSLFTTHQSFKDQPKAHWVTHNPLFY